MDKRNVKSVQKLILWLLALLVPILIGTVLYYRYKDFFNVVLPIVIAVLLNGLIVTFLVLNPRNQHIYYFLFYSISLSFFSLFLFFDIIGIDYIYRTIREFSSILFLVGFMIICLIIWYKLYPIKTTVPETFNIEMVCENVVHVKAHLIQFLTLAILITLFLYLAPDFNSVVRNSERVKSLKISIDSLRIENKTLKVQISRCCSNNDTTKIIAVDPIESDSHKEHISRLLKNKTTNNQNKIYEESKSQSGWHESIYGGTGYLKITKKNIHALGFALDDGSTINSLDQVRVKLSKGAFTATLEQGYQVFSNSSLKEPDLLCAQGERVRIQSPIIGPTLDGMFKIKYTLIP